MALVTRQRQETGSGLAKEAPLAIQSEQALWVADAAFQGRLEPYPPLGDGWGSLENKKNKSISFVLQKSS
jgi:hypothetical protein